MQWNEIRLVFDSYDSILIEEMSRYIFCTPEIRTENEIRIHLVRGINGKVLAGEQVAVATRNTQVPDYSIEYPTESEEGSFFVYPELISSGKFFLPFRIFRSGRWERYGDVFLNMHKNEMSVYLDEVHEPAGYKESLMLVINPLFIMLQKFGYFRVHAACAGKNSKCVLFPGVSGSGKSTAGFMLYKNGFDFLHDESVLLKKNAEGFGTYRLSSLFKIRKDSAERFFPFLQTPFKKDEEEIYIPFESLGPCASGIGNFNEVIAVVCLEKSFQKNSALKKESSLKVLPDLLNSALTGLNPTETLERFNFLAEFLDFVPVFRAEFGTEAILFAEQIDRLF